MPDNQSQKVSLAKVRLSFPVLFKPKAFSDGGEAKFGANFLLHKEKHKAAIKKIREAIDAAIKDKWPKGQPKGLKIGLYEASEKDYDGYDEDHLFISTSTPKRVPVVGRKLEPLVESDGKPYAGCWVNATVRAWAQDNQYGKRVNFELLAVQFDSDGDAFGGGAPVDPQSEFKALDDEDEDDDV